MSTPSFAVFIIAAIATFHLLPARARAGWLLLASYVFYAVIAWQFVPVLALLSVATYLLGSRLASPAGLRGWTLLLGVTLNVGALVGLRWAYPLTPFAAPFAVVGLSFYTLQAISYLADLYTGALKRPASLLELSLYLAYFPKLLAGPIERAGSFIGKINDPRVVDDDTAARAFTLIVIGISRKVIIADPLRGLILPEAFSAPEKLGAVMLAASIFTFAVVLYNDFAGYTGIARAVSLLFGVELSPNFARPFFATSFTDFWNRWHITLSLWLRDYIYLPLSRTLLRRNPSLWNVPNLILPPLLAMLASGFWHGGSLHMLVWGGLHGVFLIVERLILLVLPPRHRQAASPLKRVLKTLLVLVFGIAAFAFFRMELTVAVTFFKRVLSGAAGTWPSVYWLTFLVPSFWLDFIEARHGDETAFNHWPKVLRAALLAVVLALWFLLSRSAAPAPFIYRGF